MRQRPYGEGELRLGTAITLDPSIYSYSYAMYINDEEITKFMDILSGKVNEKIEEEGEVESNKVLAFLRKRLASEIAEEKKYEEIELTKVKKEEKGKSEKDEKKKTNVNGSSESDSGSDSDSKSSKKSSDDEKSEALLSKKSSSSDSESDTGTEDEAAAAAAVAGKLSIQRRKSIFGVHKEGEEEALGEQTNKFEEEIVHLAQEKHDRKLFQVRAQKRVDSLLMTLLTFVCQLILCVLIFLELTNGICNKNAFVTMLT